MNWFRFILPIGLCSLTFLLADHLPRWARSAEQAAANRTEATIDDVHRWIRELSNWGRWGDDDELGAINLITPAKRVQAARGVRWVHPAHGLRPHSVDVYAAGIGPSRRSR